MTGDTAVTPSDRGKHETSEAGEIMKPDRQFQNLSERFHNDVVAPLKSTFVGKDDVIDLLAIGLISGENVFLQGPPGTAKSAVVQKLAEQIQGNVFDYLLTRFTEPNEVFGPFDIRKLRDGDLVTNTDGMLPEADFVFLDELLNANSAILNSLLMVLNERVFRRGRETRSLPTLMVVGASNRLPDDDALNALFDRFLLRVNCDNVSTEQLQDVLVAGWNYQNENSPATSIRVDDIRALQTLILDVHYRRAVKLQRVLAASAILSGRLRINPTDFWVLNYIWDTVQQQEVLRSIVTRYVDEATKEEKDQSHPSALESQLPDAEQIATSLNQIEKKIEAGGVSDVDQTFLKDQICVIRERAQWIKDDQRREFLNEKADQLLSAL